MRINSNLLIFVLLINLLISGCNLHVSKEAGQGTESDLKYTRTTGSVKIDVIYKPSKELRTKSIEEDPSQASFDKFYYFVVNISVNGKDLETNAVLSNDFGQKIQELSSNMQEHIKALADGKEEVGLVDYIFPRMYGSTPSTSFMVCFDRASFTDSRELDVVVSYPSIGILNETFKYRIKDLEDASGL